MTVKGRDILPWLSSCVAFKMGLNARNCKLPNCGISKTNGTRYRDWPGSLKLKAKLSLEAKLLNVCTRADRDDCDAPAACGAGIVRHDNLNLDVRAGRHLDPISVSVRSGTEISGGSTTAYDRYRRFLKSRNLADWNRHRT